MVLKTQEPDALFHVDPPPHGLVDFRAWTFETLQRLERFLRTPEFAGVMFARIDTVVDPLLFKAEDGMMIYAGPGVLGPQEGFYVRESGAWKKVAGT
jgi:hypothetical protein